MDYAAVVYPCGLYFGRVAFQSKNGETFDEAWTYWVCISVGVLYCLTPLGEL